MISKIKNYKIEVLEYEYTADDKSKLLDFLEQKYGWRCSIKRSGPKLVSPGKCHENLHHMVVHISS